VLEEYKADYKDIMEFKGKMEQFPLRAAVAQAIAALQNSASLSIRPTLSGAKDQALANLKKDITAEQQNILAPHQLELKEALQDLNGGPLTAIDDEMKALRKKETKRWQVLYDFVSLRLKSRLIYVADYNFILGQFRGDTRADLGVGDRLWRLAPKGKLSTNENLYKDLALDVKKGLEKLVKDYPDTPWALQAQRESELLLGVYWQPAKN
jgi:hypothetical protein